MSVPGGYQTAGGPMGGGPQQPQGGWDPARSEQDTGPIPRVQGPGAVAPGTGGGTRKIDPAKLLGLAVAVLGALNFIWGFLPELTAARSNESLSVFAVGPAYVPVLLLIAGLLALAAFLPGSERSRLAVAAVSVGGAAGAIVSLGTAGSVELVATTQVGKGLGAILLVIFGIVQAVVAIGAYVIGADFSQVRSARPSAGQAAVGQAAVGQAAASAWSGAPQPAAGGTWQTDPSAARPGWYGPGPAGAPGYPGSGGYGAAPAQSWAADRRLHDAGSPAPDDSDTGPQAVVDPAALPPGAADAAKAPADSDAAAGGSDAAVDAGLTVQLRSPAADRAARESTAESSGPDLRKS